MVDARRQMVLRTFASTGGDAARTAKLLGVDPADVRTDLLSLLEGTSQAAVGAGRVVAEPALEPTNGNAKKKLAKKR